jgi:perosamine synthetase
MLSHLEPAYAGHATGRLPQSEIASSRSLLLPLYPQLTEAEQDRVVSALFEAAGISRALVSGEPIPSQVSR